MLFFVDKIDQRTPLLASCLIDLFLDVEHLSQSIAPRFHRVRAEAIWVSRRGSILLFLVNLAQAVLWLHQLLVEWFETFEWFKIRPLRKLENGIECDIFRSEITPDTTSTGIDLFRFIASIRFCHYLSRKTICGRMERQPVPDVANSPVQKWSKGISNALRRRDLKPPLATFRAILRAG